MTKRIVTTPATVHRLEAVSPVTTIQWDPATETGAVTFEVWDMVYENDEYKGLVRNQELPTITASIGTLAARTVTIDSGQEGGTTTLPVLVVSPILRKLFDELYNELAQQATPIDVPIRGQRPVRTRP